MAPYVRTKYHDGNEYFLCIKCLNYSGTIILIQNTLNDGGACPTIKCFIKSCNHMRPL